MKELNKNFDNTINTKLILEYIQINNLTMKEFCKQCNISIATFYRIIKHKNFKLISLFRIAKKIQAPVHTLFK